MDLHFEIPHDLPVHDHGVDVDTATAKPSSGTETSAQRKFDAAEAQRFLASSGLIPLLNELLLDVYLTQPEDPIDYMTKWCLRYVPSTDLTDAAIQAERNAELTKRHSEAVSYSTKFKLPQLFDELLSAMVTEKPAEPSRFAMSWLRWHKKVFVQRHRPVGYEAFVASMDERK